MVFKCCVVKCRSNYDTQPKKYPVFAFPSQPELREKWLERITTKSQKITNSSRVCIRHFNPEEIKKTSKQRSVLMPNAVPVGNEHVIESDSESEEETQVEIVEPEEDIIEQTGITFEEFAAQVDEHQEAIVENWNIYNHPNAICFYRLSKYDENFNDFSISFKIIVNYNMTVKVCRGDTEGCSSELLWILPHLVLQTFEQFEQILSHYSLEPEILPEYDPQKHLRIAYEHLEQVKVDGIQEDLEKVKQQIYSMMEENFEKLEEPIIVEALEGDIHQYGDDTMEEIEEIDIEMSQKTAKLEEIDEIIRFKDQNYSDDDFRFQEKSEGKKIQKESHSGSRKFGIKREIKLYSCSYCIKAFRSQHSRREHEKTHQMNPELESYLTNKDGHPRYVCPNCTQDFEFSFMLKRHIDGNCVVSEKKRKYRYPCASCGKEFPTKIAAAAHMSNSHRIVISNVDKWCFDCNAEFEDYVNHVRMHSCNFSCLFCGARFLTEEKAFNHQLEKHANETEDARQFKCMEEGCGLSFKIMNHLRSHQMSMHTQQRRSFQCDQCPKSFAQKGLLNAHQRTHSEVGIFSCNFSGCTRTFKKLTNLKEHALRDHKVGNIYLCKFEGCEQRFKMLNDLKNHCQTDHKCSINIQKYFDSP